MNNEKIIHHEKVLLSADQTMALGNLNNKTGYVTGKFDIEKLKKAISVLENWFPKTKNGTTVCYLHLCKDKPMMIGNREIGVIIAPMSEDLE